MPNINSPFRFGSIVSGDYFYNREDTLGKQTPYRRKVLEALFYALTEIYLAETARTFGLSSANTQSAFKYLLNDSVVEKIDNTYVFSDPFLKLFIKKYIVGNLDKSIGN